MSKLVNQIRIGVLGCANIAKKSVIPAILQIPEFKLIAVASRSIDKAESFAKEFSCEAICGYDNLINRKDIDAIYVPLPTGLHEKWIIKALKSNKHVLSEKSFALNPISAEKMIKVSNSNKVVLMENLMYKFHSQHDFVFNLLNNGELGNIKLIKASFGFPPLDTNNFRYNYALGGGAILDAAAYTVSTARWFLGNNVEVICSNLTYNNNSIVINGSASLFSKENGIVAQISYGFDNFYQCKYEIWGSKGYLICDKAYTPTPVHEPKIYLFKDQISTEYSLKPDNHFIKILIEFKNLIQNKYYTKYHDELYQQSKILDDLVHHKNTHKYIYEGIGNWM